jgi:hypothetical protein
MMNNIEVNDLVETTEKYMKEFDCALRGRVIEINLNYNRKGNTVVVFITDSGRSHSMDADWLNIVKKGRAAERWLCNHMERCPFYE